MTHPKIWWILKKGRFYLTDIPGLFIAETINITWKKKQKNERTYNFIILAETRQNAWSGNRSPWPKHLKEMPTDNGYKNRKEWNENCCVFSTKNLNHRENSQYKHTTFLLKQNMAYRGNWTKSSTKSKARRYGDSTKKWLLVCLQYQITHHTTDQPLRILNQPYSTGKPRSMSKYISLSARKETTLLNQRKQDNSWVR